MKIEKGREISAHEKVDRYRSIIYAGASGDFNPIHIDPEFAKKLGLGGSILHGLCTLAFVAKSVTDCTGDPGSLRKLSCRFSAPVLSGDEINISGSVAEVQDSRGRIDLKVVNQNGLEVLQKVVAEVDA
ncbi:MAG: hypothetical protein JXA07_10845 [Spirochaetes bacterium]|nr:hypothetical protein [Spirochaetota bacterium]